MKGDTASMTIISTPDSAHKERELFLSLLLPVKKNLYNFVRKSLAYTPEADDIFQEALLKGFRYFYSFDRDKSFKTWIFTIAHNLVKDRFMFLQKNPSVSLDDVGEIAGDKGPVSISEEAREVYAVAGELPPRSREVFFLYYYNEFRVAEIVEITGLSRALVKFILHQARSAIKKRMEVRR
jgi:RNA polymerase sigma-70 factor (ECF subfamily)